MKDVLVHIWEEWRALISSNCIAIRAKSPTFPIRILKQTLIRCFIEASSFRCGTREIDCFDYSSSSNPPVLHRKETFILPENPLYSKYARLTLQEDKQGLLSDSKSIGTRDGWNKRLSEAGYGLKGHRLIKLKDGVEPYPKDDGSDTRCEAIEKIG